jgi:hypothetical protein
MVEDKSKKLIDEYYNLDHDPNAFDKEEIQWIIKTNKMDVRPVIALTMRACGLTLREIGEALGITKQAVDLMVKKWRD